MVNICLLLYLFIMCQWSFRLVRITTDYCITPFTEGFKIYTRVFSNTQKY